MLVWTYTLTTSPQYNQDILWQHKASFGYNIVPLLLNTKPWYHRNVSSWIYPVIHKYIFPGQGDWYFLASPAMKRLFVLKMYFRLPGSKLKFSISSLFFQNIWRMGANNPESTLGQTITRCCKATRHYIGQCWHKFMPTGVNFLNR